MAGVKGSDVDALWTALRPRILGLSSGGSGVTRVGPQGPAGPKGVTWRGAWAADVDYATGDLVTYLTAGMSVLTYICIEANTSIGGSPPTVGGDVRWHELGPGYLIIDGSRAMTGDLDHGGHSIVDAHDADIEGTATVGEDIVLTGAAGAAQIRDPRVIMFESSVIPGTDYTEAEGAVSWDATSLIDQLVSHADTDSGMVKLPGLGVYIKLENTSGATIPKGTVARAAVGSQLHAAAVPLGSSESGEDNATNALGALCLALHDIADQFVGWACVHGLALGIDTQLFASGDRIYWDFSSLAKVDMDPGSPAPVKGTPHVIVGSVVVAAAGGVVWVDFDWRTKFDDLANVRTPGRAKYDYPTWAPNENTGYDVWIPLPASYFPVTEVPADTVAYLVEAKDVALHAIAPCSISLPEPGEGDGTRRISITHGGGTGNVVIVCPTYGIHGIEAAFSLVKEGETLSLQSVNTLTTQTWVTQ